MLYLSSWGNNPWGYFYGKEKVGKMKSTDSVIVSWDFSHGKDVGVLIVGKQEKGKVEIINAYQGEEAEALYQKLVFPKSKKTNFSREKTT